MDLVVRVFFTAVLTSIVSAVSIRVAPDSTPGWIQAGQVLLFLAGIATAVVSLFLAIWI